MNLLSIDEFAPKFRDECGLLSLKTRHVGWADEHGVPDAEPISKEQWLECLATALLIAKEIHGLPAPTPGADPKGFCWLTYEHGERRVAVELRAPRFVWTIRKDGFEQEHSSDKASELANALKQTFHRT